MSTETKVLTFEEYLALPEMRKRYDIVDGVLIMAAAPTPLHQWIILEIAIHMTQFVRGRALGVVLHAPCDIVIQRAPLRTRQPDVFFLSAERTGITGPEQLKDIQVLEMAPDLVVEVLSPSNRRTDVESKLKDYEKIGVREYWLVSHEAGTIEVVGLSFPGTRSLKVYNIDEAARSEVLSGFTLRLRDMLR